MKGPDPHSAAVHKIRVRLEAKKLMNPTDLDPDPECWLVLQKRGFKTYAKKSNKTKKIKDVIFLKISYTRVAQHQQDRFAGTDMSHKLTPPPLAQPGLYRGDRRHHPCGAQPLRYQESHRHPRLQGKAILRTRKVFKRTVP
jgi:hypothetical protein